MAPNKLNYDVCGIGSPLFDVSVFVDDSFLEKNKLEKGNSHHLDLDGFKKLETQLDGFEKKITPGGSVANTLAAVRLLGGSSFFYGIAGEDALGLAYQTDLKRREVSAQLFRKGMTGQVISLITPDSERTFAAFLGHSNDFLWSEVKKEPLETCSFLHLTSYQLEEGPMNKTIKSAAEHARDNGAKISFDLGNAGIVEKMRDGLLEFIKNSTDILISNEDEAKALFSDENADPNELVQMMSDLSDLAVLKLGKVGSIIMEAGIAHRIPAVKVNAIDTTGAGDVYAAGLLHCLSQGEGVENAGRVAAALSAKVVSVVGARLDSLPNAELEDIKKLCG